LLNLDESVNRFLFIVSWFLYRVIAFLCKIVISIESWRIVVISLCIRVFRFHRIIILCIVILG
jgi:hypothetical protein